MKINKQNCYAAIDVGTNSFHLIIGVIDPKSGQFRIIDREKEVVRLGAGSSDMKVLSRRAMFRGIVTLKRFKAIADTFNASIKAIATSAVREAANRDEFLRYVRRATGIKIEIASGIEEARLIYLGVLQAIPVFSKKILLIDIGGGSTEFLVGCRKRVVFSESLKLGAIRLTNRFFHSKKLSEKSIRECRDYLTGMLDPVARELKEHDYEISIGSSGTILNIATMIRLRRGEFSVSTMNNFTFTREELLEVVELLLREESESQRARIPGLDAGRADIIVAGALILEQIFRKFKLKSMTVSESALREGIIFDAIEKRFKRQSLHHLQDIRYKNVIQLAEHFQYEKRHAHHVASLALKIFDQTQAVHQLGPTEREFLEIAALLHEIGFFISHDQHHRHSYYLIRNASLMGFTDDEKEIIAHIARYHRKSHPKPKHESFIRLSPDDQGIIKKLASILRIADGLDRTHSQIIKEVICKKYDKILTLHLKKRAHTSTDLEVWGADRKKGLFEETFGVKVQLKAK